MVLKLFYHWFTVFLAVGALAHFVSGSFVDNAITAALVAVFLTVIHLLIKPLIQAFHMPVNLVSLGIMSIVLNIIVIWVLGNGLLDGFSVFSFLSAFLGSVILTILTLLNNKMTS
jgi:putative membrane protein